MSEVPFDRELIMDSYTCLIRVLVVPITRERERDRQTERQRQRETERESSRMPVSMLGLGRAIFKLLFIVTCAYFVSLSLWRCIEYTRRVLVGLGALVHEYRLVLPTNHQWFSTKKWFTNCLQFGQI